MSCLALNKVATHIRNALDFLFYHSGACQAGIPCHATVGLHGKDKHGFTITYKERRVLERILQEELGKGYRKILVVATDLSHVGYTAKAGFTMLAIRVAS